jgi:hypothetical protein
MATFSGGKALKKTVRFFIRTRNDYGRKNTGAGTALYTFGDNEYGVLRPFYCGVGGASDPNNHIHIAAYFRQDYVRDTNNNTQPTWLNRTYDLDIFAQGDIDGGEKDFIGTREAIVEKPIPSNSDLHIWTNYSGSMPNDAYFVFIGELDVYSINEVVGNP